MAASLEQILVTKVWANVSERIKAVAREKCGDHHMSKMVRLMVRQEGGR